MRQVIIALITIIAGLLPNKAMASYYYDISHAFTPDELTQISVGENLVPIFESLSNQSLSRGVAIILADQSPDGLSLSNAIQLSYGLNQKGWHTVVSPAPIPSMINPTQDDPKAIHPRIDNRHQAFDYSEHSQHLMLLINALNAHLEHYQGYNLVIAQGMNAAQLLDLGSRNAISEPNTLVAIAPYWPDMETNKRIPQFISETEFPVLDLSIPYLNFWEQQTVKMRKTLATTSLKLHYRQQVVRAANVKIQPTENEINPYIQSITSSILGWIRYLGW